MDHNPFVRKSCKRDLDLENLFQIFNAKYFRGKLEKYKVYVCNRSKNFGHLNVGWCSASKRKIFLRSNVPRKIMAQTLAHEMVHAKLRWVMKETHGKLFIKELKRIRTLGAQLSPADVDISKRHEPPAWNKRSLERSIRDAIVVEGLTSYSSISKYLEREFSEPISEINRLYDSKKIRRVIISELST